MTKSPIKTISDGTLQRVVGELLLKEEASRAESHIPSGKLAASRLWWPLQWQVLNWAGVPQRPLDEYTLRKFQRGNHVEDWLVSKMPGVVERQKEADYKGAIGYIDALTDTKGYDTDYGLIPHEVKSVTNLKFKMIEKNGPDMGHVLQVTLYGLAEGSEYVAIDYVASDDYRIKTFILRTDQYDWLVDTKIKEFNEAITNGVIPDFAPNEKWQASRMYCSYPDFLNMKSSEALAKIEREYPEAYKKITGTR